MGGAEASFLEHQLERHLNLVESLRMATRVHLADIPSVDKALQDLGTFDFFASHLFYACRRHSPAVTELF